MVSSNAWSIATRRLRRNLPPSLEAAITFENVHEVAKH